uniref:Uncharacterized protein n=1 Tax=Rhodotorula toruloides TaxID=5286 RepID=A0A0K3CNV3_RHOTO
MEERGNVAALVRAAHRPKLKEYIYWFHAKTPEEQEYLRPKLERWIHKQRDGARKKRQAKRKSPSPELGADLGMSLDPAKEQEQEQAGGADLGGFDQQYYSPEPFQPDSEVVSDSQDVVADSQEDVVEETDDEGGYGYAGDEELDGYEGTIFADTGEHGGYDPALWLWQEGEDELPHEGDDLPNVAHSPSPSSRQPMDVDEHVQHRAAESAKQEEAEDDFVRVKEEDERVKEADASPRLDAPPRLIASTLTPAEPAATKPATMKPAAIVDLSDSDDSSDDDDPLAERRLRAKVVLYNKALEMHYEELAREPGGAEKVAQEKAEASKGWQEGYAAMEAAWRKYRHRLPHLLPPPRMSTLPFATPRRSRRSSLLFALFRRRAPLPRTWR